MTSTPSTPPIDWDGLHLFLRYQSEESFYYASVARRDGHVVLKKKCVGGPSNGGTYDTLAETSGRAVAPGAWRRLGGSVKTLADGSVELSLRQDGTTILRAVDRGTGVRRSPAGARGGSAGTIPSSTSPTSPRADRRGGFASAAARRRAWPAGRAESSVSSHPAAVFGQAAGQRELRKDGAARAAISTSRRIRARSAPNGAPARISSCSFR